MYSIVWKIAERAEKYSGRDGKKLFLIINTLLCSLAASVLAAAVSVITDSGSVAVQVIQWSMLGGMTCGFYGGILYLFRKPEK